MNYYLVTGHRKQYVVFNLKFNAEYIDPNLSYFRPYRPGELHIYDDFYLKTPQDKVYFLIAYHFFILPVLKDKIDKDLYLSYVNGMLKYITKIEWGEGYTSLEHPSNSKVFNTPNYLLKKAIAIDPYATCATISYLYKNQFIELTSVESFIQDVLPETQARLHLKDKLQFMLIGQRAAATGTNPAPDSKDLISTADMALAVNNANFNGEKQISLINNLIMQLLMQYDFSCSTRAIELWEKYKKNPLNSNLLGVRYTIDKHYKLIESGKFQALEIIIQNFKGKLENCFISLMAQADYKKLITFLDIIVAEATPTDDSKNKWIEVIGDNIFLKEKYHELITKINEIIPNPHYDEGKAFLEFKKSIENMQSSFAYKPLLQEIFMRYASKNRQTIHSANSDEVNRNEDNVAEEKSGSSFWTTFSSNGFYI